MAHKTRPYDTKMLLKFVFDEKAFVKFKFSNNFKQNIDETHSKQAYANNNSYSKNRTNLWLLHIIN